jgi:acetyltransferase-like isoleucine patch superfamily enzyme
MLARNLFYKFLKKIGFVYIKNSYLGQDSKVEPGTEFINSKIDRHSYIGYDSLIINVNIGSFCSIANKVTIGGAMHPMHFVSTSPAFLSHRDSIKTKYARHNFLPQIKTTIGHDVWIGEGVFIKAGVKIGTGSVIGMGSVVTKDVPPYAIVAGNPAKLIRYRFEQCMIDRLLKSEWWILSPTELKKYGPLFNDPEKFLDKFESEVS